MNDVRASFRFADGLIVGHRDEFDFHRWARQALGGGAGVEHQRPEVTGTVCQGELIGALDQAQAADRPSERARHVVLGELALLRAEARATSVRTRR